MEEEQYWFEGVPVERRYWFLVRWGRPDKRGAEPEDAGFPAELWAELEDRAEEVRAEHVFGESGRDSLREIRALRERMDAVGYAPHLVRGADSWWTAVLPRGVRSNDVERVEAPTIFTTKAAAEEQLRVLVESEPEGYLDLLGRFEESEVNEAFENSAPLRAVWVDQDALLEGLRGAAFLSVIVDGRLKLREDFIEELLEEGEE